MRRVLSRKTTKISIHQKLGFFGRHRKRLRLKPAHQSGAPPKSFFKPY